MCVIVSNFLNAPHVLVHKYKNCVFITCLQTRSTDQSRSVVLPWSADLVIFILNPSITTNFNSDNLSCITMYNLVLFLHGRLYIVCDSCFVFQSSLQNQCNCSCKIQIFKFTFDKTLISICYLFQAYHKLAKEFHPDKNPEAGDKVCWIILVSILVKEWIKMNSEISVIFYSYRMCIQS